MTQPDLSIPYPIFVTNGCVRAKSSERGSFTPTETSEPSPPRKTKIFFPTFATWSPGHGSSARFGMLQRVSAKLLAGGRRSGHWECPSGAYRSLVVVSPEKFPNPEVDERVPSQGDEAVAVLAGGCFWCVEAVYKQLDGVKSVTSGYAGGTAETADYDVVSSGRTGHAEAVEVRFDPSKVSYGQLLKVFFSIAHDPTTRDRQGPDVGKQYRSAIFYADDAQRRVADAYIAQIGRAKVFDAPIVTEVKPLERFYEAEDYHQDYADRNPTQPYIVYNAAPKVQKVRKYFPDRLKVT